MPDDIDTLLDDVSKGFAEIEQRYGTAPRQRAGDVPELNLSFEDDDGDADPEVTNASSGEVSHIAELNDLFRRGGDAASHIPGFRFESPAVMEMGEAVIAEVHKLVAEYDEFDALPNPSGEHDMGVVLHPKAGEITWQIICYADDSLTADAADPTNLKASFRVLSYYTTPEIEMMAASS